MPERWVGRDRGPMKNYDRDLQLVVRSQTPLVGDESGQNRTTQPETGKYRNRQNISDVYRLLPTVLNSLEILLLSEPIATMAPRAMRAAIRAYSIRSWPDSSFIRFLKSSFITVLLVNSRTVIHEDIPGPRCVGGDCHYIALGAYSIAMPFKCYLLLLWSKTLVLKPNNPSDSSH